MKVCGCSWRMLAGVCNLSMSHEIEERSYE